MTDTPKSPELIQRGKPAPNVEDEIRRRAYYLYEQRGREDGRDVEDWLRAEEEVRMQSRRGQRVA